MNIPKLLLPVTNGTPITQTYLEHIDYRIAKGLAEDRYHAGIDYGGDDLPVTLCDAGVLERVRFDDNGYGLHAKFKHEWGYSLYAHLKSTLPESSIGTTFEQGAVIGVSNNTGFSTGPHLHFETRDLDNVVFDPTTYLISIILPDVLTHIVVISPIGLNMRSEPRVSDDTFLGTVQAGFQADVLEEKQIDGNRWIKVPVWLAAEYAGEIFIQQMEF